MGNEYTKVCLVRPLKPFEIVTNIHSKRKSPTAISFMEKTRALGDDAIPHQGKKPMQVPMFFPNLAGKSEAVTGLPERFYPNNLATTERGTLEYSVKDAKRNLTTIPVEELIGHFVDWSVMLAEEAARQDGASIKIREGALTVPTDITYLQRRALIDGLDIGGISKTFLVRELGGVAVQRALDIDWEGNKSFGNSSFTTLFVNVGSTKAEACVVKYSPVKIAMNTATHIEVLGCGIEGKLGGHYFDLAVADKALEKFLEKHPKLSGITESSRALRKLVAQAEKTKVTLSANTNSRYQVEGLFEDTDFGFMMSREELEALFPDIEERLGRPINVALERANETVLSLGAVEVVGGGSRVPMIQAALGSILNGPRKEKDIAALELGRHLNGDEAMATGSAFVVANVSTHFKVKKMWYSDVVEHDYRLRVTALNKEQIADSPLPDGEKEENWDDWKRDISFKRGVAFPVVKNVRIRAPFDLKFEVSESGTVVQELNVFQFEERKELLTKNDYNLTSAIPTVSLMFGIGQAGIPVISEIETHLFYSQEHVTYKKIPKNKTSASNETSSENATSEETPPTEEPKDEPKDDEASDDVLDESASDSNTTNSSNTTNASNDSANFEKIISYKKKKVKLAIKVSEVPMTRRSMNKQELELAKTRLKAMKDADQYVQDLDAMRNTLETNIYMAREKCEDEAIVEVSTSEELEAVQALSSETQMWLEDYGYDADTTLELLQNKSLALETSLSVLTGRAIELEQREQVIEMVDQVLKYVNETVELVKANRTWVTPEQREVVTNKTEQFAEWWANVTEAQAKKSKKEDPAYTVKEVSAKIGHIRSEGERLLRIQYIPKVPPTPPPSYDDYFKNSNFSKEWYEQFRKNMSDSEFNFSNFNFSNMNFSNFSNSSDGKDEL
jgi:hypoxia up-regulated 1